MSIRAPRGLHHVTAVCNDWERTTHFYRALGFHLIKNTVNFDSPETRHVYYADAAGTPGTVLTFFEWPSGQQGRPGLQSAHHVAIELPVSLPLADAQSRLESQGRPSSVVTDQGERGLETSDPDGLALRIFAGHADGPRLRHCGLYGAAEKRAGFFRDTLSFDVSQREGEPPVVAGAEHRALVLLPGAPGPGRIAPGAVHHIAFAVTSEQQRALADKLKANGHHTTEVIDRVYFRSVYTRDPAGHILELATMGPGFAVDEPADALGQRLVLPAWLEDQREKIEEALARRH